ncbi:MAG: hypothetical protein LBD13_05875 [Spirochaetaceae bacterium]|jgi:hypothetical protein|nr:hypothetical protein [Spirochaetaceae bacterium]
MTPLGVVWRVYDPPNSLKEAHSADNSLYNNDLSGDRIVFLDCKELFLDYKKTFLDYKKTGFPAALCYYTKNYRRFRASLKRCGGS